MQTIAAFARQTKKYAAELNLFIDEASRSNSFHLRTAIISSRIYIVLLPVAVSILVVYTSLRTQSEVITIRNPSHADYKDLLNKHATTLSCPCSRVTIPYGNFTGTTVEYHPICSSVFVSDDWINRLFRPDIGSLYQGDFRALANSYFQLLATFCSHADRSVHDVLDNFHSETLLTSDVLLLNSLDAQIEVKSKSLQLSTTNSVRQLLQLVRTTTQANALQTVLSMSTIMARDSRVSVEFLIQRDISFLRDDNSECMCVSTRNCSMPSGFFDISKKVSQIIEPFLIGQPLANVSGFFVGCSALESILQSTFECLFDWSCLNNIHTYIPSSNITGIYALNTSQTRFPPSTSIETIINHLFIEKWSMKANFSNYYAQCAPIQCAYTSVQRNNALYVLTKLLGLYGGLTAALRICIPFIVAWWRKRRAITSAESRPSEYRYLKSPRLVLLKSVGPF